MQVPLSPEQFAALAAKVEKEQGISLAEPEGKISKMGVTAAYKYAAGILTVDILEKPFFVSKEYCEQELSKFLRA